MPEGPEVKTITDFLHLGYRDQKIISIKILSGRYNRKSLTNIENINLPLTIESVRCKGKFIYFICSDDWMLFNSLGMTGSWSKEKSKHSRLEFCFDSGDKLYFADIRNFGTLKFVKGSDVLNEKLMSIGPDMLSGNVDFETFKEKLSKKDRTISENIMDQSMVSGVGNYLKSEILYAAKISPHRKVSTLTENELEKIYKNTKDIIKFSYSTGGATIRDYYTPSGKKGGFSKKFAVYNQAKDPLGNVVIKEKTADKRTTHWVPNIQK